MVPIIAQVISGFLIICGGLGLLIDGLGVGGALMDGHLPTFSDTFGTLLALAALTGAFFLSKWAMKRKKAADHRDTPNVKV